MWRLAWRLLRFSQQPLTIRQSITRTNRINTPNGNRSTPRNITWKERKRFTYPIYRNKSATQIRKSKSSVTRRCRSSVTQKKAGRGYWPPSPPWSCRLEILAPDLFRLTRPWRSRVQRIRNCFARHIAPLSIRTGHSSPLYMTTANTEHAYVGISGHFVK